MPDSTKCQLLLEHFTAYTGYKIDDYYGVTMMTVKKDRSFSLQLQYGYKKRAENSNSLIIKDIDRALEVYRILVKYAVPMPELNEPSLSFLEEI